MTFTVRRPQISKVEYLCNHFFEQTQSFWKKFPLKSWRIKSELDQINLIKGKSQMFLKHKMNSATIFWNLPKFEN